MQHAQQDKQSEAEQLGRALVSNLIASQNVLKAYIRKSLAQEADVEDIFQKLLVKALRKQDSHLIENPQAYAYKMLQNLIVDHVREQQKQPETLEIEPECGNLSLDDLLEHNQRVAVYQEVIESMPALRRAVFIRRRLHGETRKEIASALGLAEEAVKKHITRAMDDLRQAVEKRYSIINCPLSEV